MFPLEFRGKVNRQETTVMGYPPVKTADTDKEAFYEDLNSIISSVPYKHRLFVLGDFNARIGRDFMTWPKVL